jgi:hypothetical protein
MHRSHVTYVKQVDKPNCVCQFHKTKSLIARVVVLHREIQQLNARVQEHNDASATPGNALILPRQTRDDTLAIRQVTCCRHKVYVQYSLLRQNRYTSFEHAYDDLPPAIIMAPPSNPDHLFEPCQYGSPRR